MQRHWAPLLQTVTRLVMWKDLLTGAWEGQMCSSPGEEDTHVFSTDCRDPNLHPRQTYSTLPPENLYQNPEAKEGKRSHEENEEA